MILFIDTNIFLDVLLNREPLAENSEKVLNRCTGPGHKIYTSAISFANITYFLNKYRPAEARFLLTQLLNTVHIADTVARDFEKALLSEMPDMEDAYQYYTALKIRGLKYFITRNTKHYKNASVPIVTPEVFIKKQRIIK